MFALFDNLGTFELILCGVAGLLVFGRRLPEVASQAGATLAKFKKSLDGAVQDSGVEHEIRKIQQALPTDVSVRDVARAAAKKMESRMRELGTPPPLEGAATNPTDAGAPSAQNSANTAADSRGVSTDAGAPTSLGAQAGASSSSASNVHAPGTVARGDSSHALPSQHERTPATSSSGGGSSAFGAGVDPASRFRGADEAPRD